MTRTSWDDFGLDLALMWASRSRDEKIKVGAVALSTPEHTLVAAGYNGRAPGEPNGRESMEQGMSGYVHCEINLLIRARWEAHGQHTVYLTHEPCAACARAIISSGKVQRVVFINAYVEPERVKLGLPRGGRILRDSGLKAAWVLR